MRRTKKITAITLSMNWDELELPEEAKSIWRKEDYGRMLLSMTEDTEQGYIYNKNTFTEEKRHKESDIYRGML